MIAKIAGSQLTYEADVLRKFEFEGVVHAVHMGHNSLIRILVFSDYETGFPRKVYNINIDDELTDDFIDRYVEDFKKKETNKIPKPKSLEIIND